MDAFCDGRRVGVGRMTLGSGRGRVVLGFSEPVTQVQLLPEEAQRLYDQLRQELRNVRPLIVLPPAPGLRGS